MLARPLSPGTERRSVATSVGLEALGATQPVPPTNAAAWRSVSRKKPQNPSMPYSSSTPSRYRLCFTSRVRKVRSASASGAEWLHTGGHARAGP